MGETFECGRCGACCRQPGFVRLEEGEAAALAACLGMDESAFAGEFTNLSPDRRSLMLKESPDGACILLGADNLCHANPAKPRQCRDFPHTWHNENSVLVCPELGGKR